MVCWFADGNPREQRVSSCAERAGLETAEIKTLHECRGTDVVPGIFLDYSSVFRQNKLFESHDLLLRIFVNTASSKRFIPLFLMT